MGLYVHVVHQLLVPVKARNRAGEFPEVYVQVDNSRRTLTFIDPVTKEKIQADEHYEPEIYQYIERQVREAVESIYLTRYNPPEVVTTTSRHSAYWGGAIESN